MNLELRQHARVPIAMQSEISECGLACLAMLSSFYGNPTDIASLRRRFPVSLRGASLSHLIQFGLEIGLQSRAIRLDTPALKRLTLPAILHWNFDHFVVLESIDKGGATLVDPALGRRRVSMDEVSRNFTGVALEVTGHSRIKLETVDGQMRLRDYLKGIRGIWSTLGQVLLLSLALQIFTLILPFYTQLVIDDVVVENDGRFLSLIFIVFGAITVLSVATGIVRTWIVISLAARLQFGWAARVFTHLMRLPLAYFERRHIADIQSRFRSLGSIQALATNTLVEGLIDGAMTVSTFTVMLIYSPALTLIPSVGLLLYVLVKLALFERQRDASRQLLINQVKESGYFLESLRAMGAIKSFAREADRVDGWQTFAAEAIRSSYRQNALTSGQQLANNAVFAIENLVVVFFAADQIIRGSFTVGMLVAFLSYKSQFTSRCAALIDKLVELRLSSVHLERLTDIVAADIEQGQTEGLSAFPELKGRIEMRSGTFQHSASDPEVFKGVNITVREGECVAIVGPSGAGKTTLLKTLAGLLALNKGSVLVDGLDLKSRDLKSYRRQVATVMQDDTLLSGTIADNIAMFTKPVDENWIRQCAEAAQILADIDRMPMGFATLVGDMGTALSGGQKQRVLLARALYTRPWILFLDEATSHLDPETERVIHEHLARLNMTRIMVAHRKETLTIADRILDIRQLKSGLVEIRGNDATRTTERVVENH